MHYELSDHEWSVIKPMLPNKSAAFSEWTTDVFCPGPVHSLCSGLEATTTVGTSGGYDRLFSFKAIKSKSFYRNWRRRRDSNPRYGF
jgi:hypothetical protein